MIEFLLAAIALLLAALVFGGWYVKQALDRQQQATGSLEGELEKLRHDLEQATAMVAALTQLTSDGIVRVNGHGVVVSLNEHAASMLSVTDGIGKMLDEVAWGYDLRPLVTQVLSEGGDNLSQTIVKGDRAFTAHVVGIGKNQEYGALIGLTEVTELQRLGRARREFVANISHELRTPVTSLQLLADTINDDLLNNTTLVREMLAKARAQIDLLSQLTSELMDLALIESGQAPIRLVNLSADQLIKDAILPLRPQAERKDITMTVSIPPDMEVLADPQAIRKVAANLTHNAIKFTGQGGRIDIRAHWRNDGTDVEIAIQDNGIGIPPQDLPRIFERFYKVDRSRGVNRDGIRGTGLGLAISKHIVEAHGGKLWAESMEGNGSTFHFTLPSGD